MAENNYTIKNWYMSAPENQLKSLSFEIVDSRTPVTEFRVLCEPTGNGDYVVYIDKYADFEGYEDEPCYDQIGYNYISTDGTLSVDTAGEDLYDRTLQTLIYEEIAVYFNYLKNNKQIPNRNNEPLGNLKVVG